MQICFWQCDETFFALIDYYPYAQSDHAKCIEAHFFCGAYARRQNQHSIHEQHLFLNISVAASAEKTAKSKRTPPTWKIEIQHIYRNLTIGIGLTGAWQVN